MFCTGMFLQMEGYEGEVILYCVNTVVLSFEKEKGKINKQALDMNIQHR
jgi:RNase P/RNase MRP subunit p29